MYSAGGSGLLCLRVSGAHGGRGGQVYLAGRGGLKWESLSAGRGEDAGCGAAATRAWGSCPAGPSSYNSARPLGGWAVGIPSTNECSLKPAQRPCVPRSSAPWVLSILCPQYGHSDFSPDLHPHPRAPGTHSPSLPSDCHFTREAREGAACACVVLPHIPALSRLLLFLWFVSTVNKLLEGKSCAFLPHTASDIEG